MSEWIRPDAAEEPLRASSAAALRQELEWASHLSLQASIVRLPGPDGNANSARIINQVCYPSKDELQCFVAMSKLAWKPACKGNPRGCNLGHFKTECLLAVPAGPEHDGGVGACAAWGSDGE